PGRALDGRPWVKPAHRLAQRPTPADAGGAPEGGAPEGGGPSTATSSSPTVSTWWVIGNASNARSRTNRQPHDRNVATSRANAAGSHDTYATARGRHATTERTTDAPTPARGGSTTTTSTPSTVDSTNRATSAETTRTWARSARLRRAAATPEGSDSTTVTRPADPTSGASAAANSPAPPYRSKACSPVRGPSMSTTAAASTSGAAGCTCQNPSAATAHSRPTARSRTSSGPDTTRTPREPRRG